MKMKNFYTVPLLALLGFGSGCSSSLREMERMTVTTPQEVWTPDENRQIVTDFQFHVPAYYFSKRSRLVITPQLMVSDSTVFEGMPLVLDAPIYNKKKHRKEKLTGYIDVWGDCVHPINTVSASFDLPYHDVWKMPEGIEGGHIVAVASVDGCGTCNSLDTIRIASISNPISLMPSVKESLALNMMEKDFVVRPKVMKGKGVAHLQFVINLYDINLKMGNNKAELEQMVYKLSPVLSDSLSTLNSLCISGMASADGSLPFNTTLAKNRAMSAKNWLVKNLQIPSQVQHRIQVDSRPEGWGPVLEAMKGDHHPDTASVKQILEKYADKNDDVQEYFIRRLPCWKDIKNRYLQKDRKVEYVYTYTLKSFTTSAELLDMFQKRPDAFSEDEMLQVATLKPSEGEKQEVYETLLKYFPQSEIGANNLAVLYLHQGRSDDALKVLENCKQVAPALLSKKAAAYLYEADYERAVELLQHIDLPEARYNLGLVRAQQRHLPEAYELLRPFADLNSVILALSVNRNKEAQLILGNLEDSRPVAEYIRAMTAARFHNQEECYDCLKKACVDSKLKLRAQSEPEFEEYRQDPRFQSILVEQVSNQKGS